MLNEFEQDVLGEQINLFIGQAASYLSEMINRKIILSIPKVSLIDRSSTSLINLNTQLNGYLLSSSIEFGDALMGKAQLVFEAAKVKKLVAMVMGEAFSEGDDLNDFLDTDLDVVKEIGNIILNAVIGGFGNIMHTKVTFDIPNMNVFDQKDLQEAVEVNNGSYLLVMDLSFNVAQTDIDGLIICTLSIESVDALTAKLREMGEGFEE
ncbi:MULTISPECIES: hypothetical protein [unclassified Fusibacter]|uniref:hypothetical protein n=1 Tax=unclassified Fusibacter TaxID=2624464 RepID=UPI0010115D8B|nr:MULTISPECIES: hypothetical protein [unclassified Fusibacter]MCK8058269.1 hypothetical protein [Fusibacter sp. A2]NPE20852.1 hypothetical protein [Fusibacter sp. A1]RXV63056.1 hypothetical protein DWB64_03390 [Fusibacter sp. A1]